MIKPTHRWMHLNFNAAKTVHRFRWYLYCRGDVHKTDSQLRVQGQTMFYFMLFFFTDDAKPTIPVSAFDEIKCETQSTNIPVYMEAFEQQKDGVLLLSGLHSPDVGLHGDQLVSDKRLSEVVKLSGIHPAQTQH